MQPAVRTRDQYRSASGAAPFACDCSGLVAIFGSEQKNAQRIVAMLQRQEDERLAAARREYTNGKTEKFFKRKLHAHLHAAYRALKLDPVARNRDFTAAVVGCRIGRGKGYR